MLKKPVVYINKSIDAIVKFDNSFMLQALLGRPLRISFALEKVRGGPVVVPRVSKVNESTN